MKPKDLHGRRISQLTFPWQEISICKLPFNHSLRCRKKSGGSGRAKRKTLVSRNTYGRTYVFSLAFYENTKASEPKSLFPTHDTRFCRQWCHLPTTVSFVMFFLNSFETKRPPWQEDFTTYFSMAGNFHLQTTFQSLSPRSLHLTPSGVEKGFHFRSIRREKSEYSMAGRKLRASEMYILATFGLDHLPFKNANLHRTTFLE